MHLIWSPGMTLESMERLAIEACYQYFQRNKTATAASLDISIRTLDGKLEKYERERIIREEAERRRINEHTESIRAQRYGHQGAQGTPKAAPQSTNSGTGLQLESVIAVASQHAVSMSERKEVQEVLPQQTGKSSAKSRRS